MSVERGQIARARPDDAARVAPDPPVRALQHSCLGTDGGAGPGRRLLRGCVPPVPD